MELSRHMSPLGWSQSRVRSDSTRSNRSPFTGEFIPLMKISELCHATIFPLMWPKGICWVLGGVAFGWFADVSLLDSKDLVLPFWLSGCVHLGLMRCHWLSLLARLVIYRIKSNLAPSLYLPHESGPGQKLGSAEPAMWHRINHSKSQGSEQGCWQWTLLVCGSSYQSLITKTECFMRTRSTFTSLHLVGYFWTVWRFSQVHSLTCQ